MSHIASGSSIRGRITFSGSGAPPDASHIFLSISPVPEVDEGSGGWAMVKKDGTFELTDVADGSYALEMHFREKKWYLRSARFGPDDVLENGLQIEKGAAGGTLEIIMSSANTQLEGSVTQNDKPVVGAHVQIRPEPETTYNHQRFKSTSTDQNGQFSVSNLAPGKYKVSAKMSAEGEAPAVASEPETITIHDGDHHSLQLKLPEPKQP